MKLLRSTIIGLLLCFLSASHAQNLALNRPVVVSSIETWTNDNPGSNMTDGSTSTRWSSDYSDPQWARVELDDVYEIKKVVLNWESAYGKAYEIQVSEDAEEWTTIYTTTTGDGGIDDLEVEGTGRYVRMYGTERGTEWGYSLWEMEVYESDEEDPNEFIFAQNELLKYGVNFSGMEAPNEGDWGNTLYEEDFQNAKEIGFKSIRVPLSWSTHALTEPPYTIEADFFERVDWVLEMAEEYDLAVIINVHHYWEMMSDPYGHKPRFEAIWQQIAERYQNAREEVFFELLNEPQGELNNDAILNEIQNDALAIIRESNPTRSILVGCKWSGYIGGISGLELPEDDRNIIYTGHFYKPLEFTHQGADWIEGADDWLGTTWGTEEEKQQARNDIWSAVNFASATNRPLHLGEYGSYDEADMESRVTYADVLTKFCMERGMSWAVWEYKSRFGVWDKASESFHLALTRAVLQDEFNETAVSTEQIAGTAGFRLTQNYPNPFESVTTISYSLTRASNVTLKVYDLLGRAVATLVEDKQTAGEHTVEWNAKHYTAGLYTYKIEVTSASGTFSESRMMLLK